LLLNSIRTQGLAMLFYWEYWYSSAEKTWIKKERTVNEIMANANKFVHYWNWVILKISSIAIV